QPGAGHSRRSERAWLPRSSASLPFVQQPSHVQQRAPLRGGTLLTPAQRASAPLAPAPPEKTLSTAAETKVIRTRKAGVPAPCTAGPVAPGYESAYPFLSP